VNFAPEVGYEWADFRKALVKVRDDLRLVSVNPDGSSAFVPAPGYVWNGAPDPVTMQTKVRDDLRLVSVNPDGSSTFVPAPGYVWDGGTSNMRDRTRASHDNPRRLC
jgi:hypothetical protein